MAQASAIPQPMMVPPKARLMTRISQRFWVIPTERLDAGQDKNEADDKKNDSQDELFDGLIFHRCLKIWLHAKRPRE
jgi:hypothetical protein